MKSWLIGLVQASALFFAAFNAEAQLDADFAEKGMKLQYFGVGNTRLEDISIQSDGKIVGVGYNMWGFRDLFELILCRFHPDGRLDSSFAINGQMTVYPSSRDRIPSKVMVDRKGNYIIAQSLGRQMAVHKVLPNGRIDSSFGSGGTFIYGMPSDNALTPLQISDIFIYPDNSIGLAVFSSGWVFLSYFDFRYFSGKTLLRLRENGTLDQTFGNQGSIFRIEEESNFLSVARVERGMKYDVSGKSYVVVNERPDTISDCYLEKRLQNGQFDISFGNNGRVRTDDVIDFGIDALFVQTNGKIIILGGRNLVRLNANGSRDMTWGQNGKQTIPDGVGYVNMYEFGNNIVIIGTKMLRFDTLAGLQINGYSIYWLNEDGTPDLTKGSRAITTFDMGRVVQGVSSAGIDPSGRLVIAGYTGDYEDTGEDLSMLRVRSDGTIDVSFGRQGKVIQMAGQNQTYMTGVVPMSDGSISVTGYSFNGATNNPFLAKHLPDGSLDKRFNGTGHTYVPDRTKASGIGLIGEHENGTFLASFRLPDSTSTNVYRRILPDGKTDLSWGQRNGETIIPSDRTIYINHLTSDFHLLVVSVRVRGPLKELIVQRFTAQGLPDQTFGTGGTLIVPFTGERNLKPYQIFFHPGHMIFVGEMPMHETAVIISMDYQGRIKTTFGTNGKVPLQAPYRLASVDAADNIYMGGGNFFDSRTVVRKLTPNGRVDSSFSNNGTFSSIDHGDLNTAQLWDIIPADNGGLLLTGEFRRVYDPDPYPEYLSIIRLDSNGQPDYSFGENGMMSASISPFYLGKVYSLVNPKDKQIMMAGNWGTVAAARYFISKWTASLNAATLMEENPYPFEFNIYPNPARVSIYMNFHLLNDVDLTIEIMDMSGRVLASPYSNLSLKAGKQTIRWDIPANLPSGVYLTRISGDGFDKTEKWIRY